MRIMIFIGIFFILFGCLIIAMPELIAYIVAGFLILIGIHITLLGYKMHKRNQSTPSSGFSFGSYEIIKKR